jgi:hypothetical protein
MTNLSDLDMAASANLTRVGVQRYAEYKASLLKECEPIDSVRMILTGFIWDESEEVAE